MHWRHSLWRRENVDRKTLHVIYQSYQKKKLNHIRLVSFLIGWTGAKLQALKGRCPKSVWCAHACACSGCYWKLRLPFPDMMSDKVSWQGIRQPIQIMVTGPLLMLAEFILIFFCWRCLNLSNALKFELGQSSNDSSGFFDLNTLLFTCFTSN